MNIGEAKQEIKNAVLAYLTKDETGDYMIPSVRQRPILLMGPPGIGKTQIMEQIAAECDLGLRSYTITHHTRQSAIGLPYIKEKVYGGETRSVTEYTMSEIIASVYDTIEESGKKEGILFIDEINCASETLAPAMLQFLQGKTFGNQKVPKGWIIVAAGNPPEYNRSVREFDVVTLDRVKVMNVEADYGVWKTYALSVGIHGSILAYLDIHKENFYRMETTVDGKWFVTARGWEDLSETIFAYEKLGISVTRELVIQYLQHPACAADFAAFYQLYRKYKSDYRIDEILSGTIRPGTLSKLKFAPIDERLEVVGLLLNRLQETFRSLKEEQEITDQLYELTKEYRMMSEERGGQLSAESSDGSSAIRLMQSLRDRENEKWIRRAKAGHNEKQVRRVSARIISYLDECLAALRELPPEISASGSSLKDSREENAPGSPEAAFETVKEVFMARSSALDEHETAAGAQLEYAFDFMEAAFGESQEMVVFITELSSAPASVKYLQEHDHPRYFRYNKSLLFDDREADVRRQLDAIREMQIT